MQSKVCKRKQGQPTIIYSSNDVVWHVITCLGTILTSWGIDPPPLGLVGVHTWPESWYTNGCYSGKSEHSSKSKHDAFAEIKFKGIMKGFSKISSFNFW